MKFATKKDVAERFEVIRRQNVERHKYAKSTHKLRDEIRRHAANRNAQLEHDRLAHAAIRPGNLTREATERMKVLKRFVEDGVEPPPHGRPMSSAPRPTPTSQQPPAQAKAKAEPKREVRGGVLSNLNPFRSTG